MQKQNPQRHSTVDVGSNVFQLRVLALNRGRVQMNGTEYSEHSAYNDNMNTKMSAAKMTLSGET